MGSIKFVNTILHCFVLRSAGNAFTTVTVLWAKSSKAAVVAKRLERTKSE